MNYENRLIFGKVTTKVKNGTFFDSRCIECYVCVCLFSYNSGMGAMIAFKFSW